jgi:predicted phage terminase large subunit-like protein
LDLETRQATESLSAYIKQAWHVIEPSTDYLHNWHIDAISEYLEAVTAGQITRLLINIVPRYMKSIAVTVMWPTWEWIKRPELRYLFASYSGLLSTKHSVDRRNIIQSDWYQERFGHIYELTSDQNVKTEYQNDKQGVMVSTGFGGSATGKGGDRVIVDDPHNPDEVESDVQREGDLRFFNRSLSTRLNDKKKGVMVVVMQRLHERDISARCLELGYTHLCLPAEAEQKTTIVLPVSKKAIVRESGELLWPEREGEKEIEQAKKSLGSYGYAAQYQQRPSPAEGGLLKRHWWQYWKPKNSDLPPIAVKQPDGSFKSYDPVELPSEFDEILQSWDMSFKDEKAAKGGKPDFVAAGVWGRKGANKYRLDEICERMDFPSTCSAVIALSKAWPKAKAKLVEDKANGSAVIATLKNKISGLIAVEPEGGKIVRANAVAPEIESGNVFLPHPMLKAWTESFIEECGVFPNGANDDRVDEMTQALNRMRDGKVSLKDVVPASTTSHSTWDIE